MRLAGVSHGVGRSTGRRDDRGFTAEWVEQSRAGKKELTRRVARSAREGRTREVSCCCHWQVGSGKWGAGRARLRG